MFLNSFKEFTLKVLNDCFLLICQSCLWKKNSLLCSYLEWL